MTEFRRELLPYILWSFLGIIISVSHLFWYTWNFWVVMGTVFIISLLSFKRGLDAGIRIGKMKKS